MNEILKMVINPYMPAPEGWHVQWLPLLGVQHEMGRPIMLDSRPYYDAISELKKFFSAKRKRIGTISGDNGLWVDQKATPEEMVRVHERIQTAYWEHLTLYEVPRFIQTKGSQGAAA